MQKAGGSRGDVCQHQGLEFWINLVFSESLMEGVEVDANGRAIIREPELESLEMLP